MRMKPTALAIITSVIAATIADSHLVGQSGALSAGQCTIESLQPKAPAGTTITAAAMADAADRIPAHCRIDGHADSPGNTVNFRLGLPVTWNGKFYFQGVGGLAGTIGSLNTGLARGYASASTDTGHVASDSTWFHNRAKEIDYGYRGTHVATVATKALTAAVYARPPQQAYFNGCSNGGRQALMEVQRYPEDFTGIIAGDPAMGTPMQVGRALVYQHMLAAADNYLPAEKVELLSKATLAACDAVDGLADGLITDPRRCTFQPQSLKCAGADGPACLTPGQVETVSRIYAPLKLANGDTYTPGLPIGHEGDRTGWRDWISGPVAPTPQKDGSLAYSTTDLPIGYRLSDQNMRLLALDEDEPGFSWRTVRFPADLPRLRTMTQILSPLDPDLRPYKSRGGKLIMYHGWADPAISAYGTLDYHEKVVKAVGGAREADAFLRTYLVPGMHHCSGGPGPNSFDMLPALEDWVERGVAPARIVASRATDGKVVRTRPLCPHPQVARYAGNGDVNDEANFRCEVP
jgi:feruloyl esterase